MNILFLGILFTVIPIVAMFLFGMVYSWGAGKPARSLQTRDRN